ncbi:MAG: flagellar biosynthetic protein FliQ [Planctomycetaceae bacterium]
MTSDLALDAVRQTLLLAAVLAAPLLLANFAISFVVSLLQAMTGIQDATISLTPRLAVGVVLLLWLLPWMLDRLQEFSIDLYRGVPL